MHIPRVYLKQTLASDEAIFLPQDKAHHISRVLRMRLGDAIKLFNNSGYEFHGILTEITKKSAAVHINKVQKINNESPLKIILCLAMAQGQYMDYAIQKAVELGVKKIIPIISEFSNVKRHDDRLEKKMTHWQNIIISAAEQSGRAQLPELLFPVLFSECLLGKAQATKLMLHPEGQQAMSAMTLNSDQLVLIIGPEGGFSDNEVNQAKEKKIIPIRLGPRILRVETAVVSALSNAQQLWGDLN